MSRARIEGFRFGVAGDAENAADGVVDVTSYKLLNASTGLPVEGGCYDRKMGAFSNLFRCGTCHLSKTECPGHFGVISTSFPVESPAFIGEIRKWLRVVCLECGAPAVDPARVAGVPRARRLAEAAKLARPHVPCGRCGAAHPKIVKSKEDYFTFFKETAALEGAAEGAEIFPSEIRAAFGRVADETVAAFGRASHPRKFILTKVPVPPNTIRPGMRMGLGPGGAASTHDTTNMIQHFLRAALEMPGQVPDEITRGVATVWSNMRQLYHDEIIGSATASATNGSKGRRSIVSGNRPPGSVMRGLARKKGRLRRNLVGKRVWMVVRSTISGNPFLASHQVGLPVAFARTVQVAETVIQVSHERLMRHFLNGTARYPGCTRVWKRVERKWYKVGGGTARPLTLEVGDRIERDVVTGDWGVFGRAPSLERSSLGAHEVVVLLDPTISTIQMNVTATPWYNADFDGDAMNLWIPSDPMARVEARFLSRVHNWFISTKSSGPVIGQIQDSVVGAFELTRRDAVVDKAHAMRAFALTARSGGARPCFAGGDAATRYTGSELVSQMLAKTPINYRRVPKWYNPALAPFIKYVPSEVETVVTRGRLVSGVLDNASIGASAAGGLFHRVEREYGAQRALEVVDGVQKLALAFLANRGFTVGAIDMVLTPAARRRVGEITAGILRGSALVTEKLVRGELIPPIGMTTREWYEHNQRQALIVPEGEVLGPILTSSDLNWNGLIKMIMTGSKGKVPNLIHIMTLIGSIEINGQRIPERFGFRRTCVYFPRFSTSPFASGFISGCYLSGLTGVETIFAAMHGRFDLINKALTTATTGYSNRKLMMSFQSFIVNNYFVGAMDRTRVVQYLSGEDGFDTRRVQPVTLRTVFLDDAQLRAKYRHDAGEDGDQPLYDAAFARVLADRDAYRASQLGFEDSGFDDPVSGRHFIPVDVAQVVGDVVALRGEGAAATPPRPSPGELAAMQKLVDGFCDTLAFVYTNAGILAEYTASGENPLPGYIQAATTLVQMYIRAELCAPVLATLAPAELRVVLDAVVHTVKSALIDPGTAAGALAAQAISEPLTQYMLDSHHRSVAGGTSKAGIERPAEIFGAKGVDDEKSAEMLLRLRPAHEGDRARAVELANSIELMDLDRFVVEWDIMFERIGDLQHPTFRGDAAWIAEYARHHPLQRPPPDLTRCNVRFVLDKATMVLKSMSLGRIAEHLRARHPETYVVHSPENSPQIVLRVFFRTGWFGRGWLPEDGLVKAVEKDLLPTTIRGIPGIVSASVVKTSRHFVEPGGGLARRDIFAVKTKGTNIAGVLGCPLVDPTRVVSSSIGDISAMYGIVAAQTAITRELKRVMGSSAPNDRHITMCAAMITLTGKVTALERGGVLAREPQNTLLSAVLGDPTNRLTNAALTGTRSRLHGAAPWLALGQPPEIGSTYNDVVVDMEFVRKNRKSFEDHLEAL